MTDEIKTALMDSCADGLTPGRKLKTFLWMVIAVIAVMGIATKIHTPDAIAIQALWIVGGGGLFVIGGQTLIDTVGKAATGYVGGKMAEGETK